MCPMFKGAIAKGFGHLCFVHENCLGISCNVEIPVGPKKLTFKASVEVKPLDLEVLVSLQDRTWRFGIDGKEKKTL